MNDTTPPGTRGASLVYWDHMILTAIFGLALGSFANVLIDRIPEGQPIRGRSHCDRCRRTLRWWELVPVVSALFLRHRCPTCRGAIPLRNTAVELGCAAVLVAVLMHHGGTVTLAGAIESFGLLALFVLAVIDARRGIVPDQITIPAIVILVIGRLAATVVIASEQPSAVSAAISAMSVLGMFLIVSVVLGAGFFWLQRLVSRGRWVGDGDIRVGALMGALFWPSHLVIALAASYIIGGTIAAALLLTRRVERRSRIPLVPFLFLGSILAIFFGDTVIAWYGFS